MQLISSLSWWFDGQGEDDGITQFSGRLLGQTPDRPPRSVSLGDCIDSKSVPAASGYCPDPSSHWVLARLRERAEFRQYMIDIILARGPLGALLALLSNVGGVGYLSGGPVTT